MPEDSRTMKILKFFFGENKKVAFKRLIIYTIVLFLGINIAQNLELSYSKKDGWTFHWQPAAKIEVKK